MRPLEIVLKKRDPRVAVRGPFVIESLPSVQTISDVLLRALDDETGQVRDDAFEYDPGDGALRTIELAPGDQPDIAPDLSTMTLDSLRGQTYTLRRIVDEDGLWASTLAAVVPADSIEAMYQEGMSMDDISESLWAALDPDTGELQELIYSSASGVYARSSGSWHRYPDDDASLDGLESIDVTGDAITAFDGARDSLTRDEVMKYAVPDDETT